MCTGTFYETGRPPAGTHCVEPCISQSGRWGSTYCYTKADKTQWGAECVKCPGKVHRYSKNSLLY